MITTKDSPNLQLDFVEIVNPRLWMSTSYRNTYVGNVAPSAALNVLAPLTGWYDCGTVKSVKMPVAKTMRELKKGTPQTSRKFWETDRTAQITFSTSDLTPYVEALIAGQTLRLNVSATPFVVASPMSLPRANALLSGNPNFSAYDVVVCASPTAASPETSFNIAVVESLTASLIALEGAGLPVAMAHPEKLYKVKRTAFIDRMGVQTIRSAILFWDDIVDGSGNIQAQHCLYFPKVRNFSGSDFDFKSETEEYETGITLVAQATFMTFDDGSTGYDFYKKWLLSY